MEIKLSLIIQHSLIKRRSTQTIILVTEEEIKEAYEEVDDELIKVIRKAIKNIRDFHEKQIQKRLV